MHGYGADGVLSELRSINGKKQGKRAYCNAKANPTRRLVNSSSLSATVRFFSWTLSVVDDFEGDEMIEGSDESFSCAEGALTSSRSDTDEPSERG